MRGRHRSGGLVAALVCSLADQVQIGVFSSSDDAEKYTSNFSGHLKQVNSVLIFALDTGSKDYDQAVSCAEEATG